MSANLTPVDGNSVNTALHQAFFVISRAASDVARYCDHAEHNEFVSRTWILEAASALRREAQRIAHAVGADLIQLFADRLGEIEALNPLRASNHFSGSEEARQFKTLKDLQRVQTVHDRNFHPDVFGLSKSDQLRHYSFHLSKIVGSLAEACEDHKTWNDFARRRLPDMFLFGLKLVTVMGDSLPDESVEEIEDPSVSGSNRPAPQTP